MKVTPIWKRDASATGYPVLKEEITADVVIIGAGITGVVLGHLLTQRNLKVVILESLQVGGGTTGSSTGNLYVPVDVELNKVKSKYDLDTVKVVAESRSSAIDLIESLVNSYKIDCSFERVPWWLFSEDEKFVNAIEKEADVFKSLRLSYEETTEIGLPFKVKKAVKLNNQAQFNPLVFVRELAARIATNNCKIYENSKVTHLDESDDKFLVRTESGAVIASHVVHATHIPKGVDMVQTLLAPYREYAIAAKLKNVSCPKGIFWGSSQSHHHSIRSFKDKSGEEFLLVLGEPHKVGQKEDNTEAVRNLHKFFHDHFNGSEILYTWGAQHYRPADYLPYIGRRSSDSKIYYSTGYSTDGLTYGTVGAMIIADQITGKENPWEKTFDATRITPLKSAKEFILENVNVLGQYLKDLPFVADVSKFSEIGPGEGKIVEEKGEKLAVYRNEDGKVEVVSAVCTHMKCIVSFNKLEKTWDCPCHGSRFNTCGVVLEGPAIADLSKPK